MHSIPADMGFHFHGITLPNKLRKQCQFLIRKENFLEIVIVSRIVNISGDIYVFNTSILIFKNGITTIRTVIDRTVVVFMSTGDNREKLRKIRHEEQCTARGNEMYLYICIQVSMYLYTYIWAMVCAVRTIALVTNPTRRRRPGREGRSAGIVGNEKSFCDHRRIATNVVFSIYFFYFLFLILPLSVLLCLRSRLRGRVVFNRIRSRRLIWKGKFRRRHRATLYTG